MYQVSAEYLTAIKKPAIRSRVVGTIAGKPFNDENILENSFSITNQNSGNDSVQIGMVYIGELSVTLRGLTFDRYMMDGMEIVPSFELLLADGKTWEPVPLGRFYVGEANHTAAGIVIKAYDGMSRFDKKYDGQQMTGKAYELAALACEACGIPFGMTEEDVKALPNGDVNLSIYSENDIETWRDYLSWLAQALGCFATIDRRGQLVFRQYTQDIVDTVDSTGRFKGASYSDYETRYTRLSVVNIGTQMTSYYHVEPDEGLTYNLGSNPFLQYGTEETYTALRQAVLDALQNIRFVPFSATMAENPAYDLGDVLSFPGGLGDENKLFCVTKFTWTYHRGIKLEGVGQNPALASARSKTDKNITGLETQVNAKDIIVHSFMNASAITISSDKERELITFNYAATADTRTIFLATIPFTTDRDGYIVIKYYLDGVPLEGDTLREYVERGEHFVTISTNRAIERNTRETLTVKAITEFFESDTRQQSAKIASILDYIDTGTYTEQTVDTTPPKMTIAKQAIKAVLYAQGLSGAKEWDGTINIAEEVAPVQLKPLRIRTLVDRLSVGTQVPMGGTFTQLMARWQLNPLVIHGLTEQIGSSAGAPIDFIVTQQTVLFTGTEFTETVDGVTKLKTEYVVESVAEEIDAGYMSSVEIVTDVYQSVESVVVE